MNRFLTNWSYEPAGVAVIELEQDLGDPGLNPYSATEV